MGHVTDFFLDDRQWAIRYVVVHTNSWLSARSVLITPHPFGSVHQTAKILLVSLTRKHIENSLLIETHKPVSKRDLKFKDPDLLTRYHKHSPWSFVK